MSAEKQWCLYVLECGDGSWYTGVTNDLLRRLAEHSKGRASRYTRSRLPIRLIYQERCAGRSDALRRELAVKALTRAQKADLIAGAGDVAGRTAD